VSMTIMNSFVINSTEPTEEKYFEKTPRSTT
jgi:hypothetical protein